MQSAPRPGRIRMSTSDKAGDMGNGKVILLYSATEEAQMGQPLIKEILEKNGILPRKASNDFRQYG
jgi:hypothetical protein